MAQIERSRLRALMAIARHAVSDSRFPAMRGLRLTSEHIAATDGSVLCIVPWHGDPLPQDTSIVSALPFALPRTVEFGMIEVTLEASAVRYSADKQAVVCPMIVGAYPDYLRMIPNDKEVSTVDLNPERLRRALGTFGDRASLRIRRPQHGTVRPIELVGTDGTRALVMPMRSDPGCITEGT